ncbi:MAG: methyltransferase domain-containing protein [Betaproteobacteria bacterium]
MQDGPAGRAKDRDEIAQAYSSEPWWYDLRGFFILTFAYRSTLWEQIRFFGGNMKAEHLEVAIGTGTLSDLILKWRRFARMPFSHVVGVDYAERMLAGARKRFAGRTDIDLERADVAALPFAANVFDSANIANAVHCLPDVDAGLREVWRVLKPGGRLAANVLLHARGMRALKAFADRINAWGMRKGILATPYDEGDVRRRIEAAGFMIISERIRGNTYIVLAEKPAAA